MQIVTHKNSEKVYEAVTKEITEATKSNPHIVLGLATGSTPVGIYARMVKEHRSGGTDYSNVTTFNLDEYEGLAGNHPSSYRYFMNDHLFNHLNILLKNTHVPAGTGDLAAACEEYEKAIEKAGGIDIQLLGIGANGHIGFNEPDTPFDTKTHIAYLAEETIQSNAKFFADGQSVPSRAVTMGISTIMKAKRIILVALGKSKAEAVQKTVAGPVTERHPASVLQRHPHVTLYLDEDAASLL
ncbi:glucosamine-6-phosphate deaminase [Negadavirga shengliensis]|uniref:Glucosamine-6-phosphate deaminase n=1 Tax=Negadavirga shengliensis TaxID=1389218 RepID=A0ABV9T0Q7_9BACT